jgi:hypothetical protein
VTSPAGAFDLVCGRLEAATSLTALEARGTVRLALEQAGMEPREVTPHQMSVVIEKLFPAELAARGISDAPGVCRQLLDVLRGAAAPEASHSPEAVFRRLGGA